MANLELNLKDDIAAIAHIDAIPAILEVICRTTGMGFAAVARVTDERWVACAVRDEIQFGLIPGGELKVDTTLCHDIRRHHQAIVIPDVGKDKVYVDHYTPKLYGLQSYISVPIITKDGAFFGTLCAIDRQPALIDQPEIIHMFNLFAELIAFHLESATQLKLKDKQLIAERKTAALRDKFIAILGHDLRNPVGAILNVAELLLRMPVDERVKRLAAIVQNSGCRMKVLIENILDFARSQLGDGIKLDFSENIPLKEALQQVVTELQLAYPDARMHTHFNLGQRFDCDTARLAQLLSNLLSNAITHGNADGEIQLLISANDGEFCMKVTNQCEPLPKKVMERFFQPFNRGTTNSKQGLGLGLYIAAEIAKAHQGTLDVKSNNDTISFTFRMAIRIKEKRPSIQNDLFF